MANDPSMVQRSILTRLRNEQEKELRLINNLLGEITSIMMQKEDRAPEIERLRELPQDHPAITIGLQTLLRNWSATGNADAGDSNSYRARGPGDY